MAAGVLQSGAKTTFGFQKCAQLQLSVLQSALVHHRRTRNMLKLTPFNQGLLSTSLEGGNVKTVQQYTIIDLSKTEERLGVFMLGSSFMK